MSAPRPPSNAPKPVRKRRVVRVSAYVLSAFVVLLAALLLWAFNTQAGAAFVLARVEAALDGKLRTGAISGSLSGPLKIEDLRYVDASSGIDARIGHLEADVAVFALLEKRVEIRNLGASDVDIAMTTVVARPDQPDSEFSLSAPIDILVEQLAVQRAKISRDGEAILEVDRLDLIGGWARNGIVIRQLSLRSPAGQVDMTGSLATIGGYSGTGETRFAWRAGDTDLAGTLRSTSNGKQARFELALDKPTAATAVATLGQTRTAPWTLQLDVPAFAARDLLPDSTLGQLALSLRGRGDRGQGSITGNASVNGHPVVLDPLRYELHDGGLRVESLHLTSPGTSGAFDLDGDIDFSAAPLAANLKARWDGVLLPADLVGQPLASHGTLAIDGSIEAFTASGALALGPPDALADIDVDIAGSAEAITLNSVRLRQENGGLEASGTLSLEPALGWQIKATANRLDPGAFFADWPGAIDFVLDTAGTQTANGPQATLKLDKVGGTPRGKPLAGSANLRMQPGYVVDGKLALQSGGSRLDVEGSGGGQTDANLRFEVASLGDWLPASGGRATGKIHVGGKWPDLDVDGDVSARELAWSGIRADSMELVAKVRNLQKPAGALTLKAANASRGDIQFDSLLLEAEGNQASHQLSLVATGTPLGIELGASGGSEKGRWNGQLKSLGLKPSGRNLPRLDLDRPMALAWDGKRFEASESCLVGSAQARETREAEEEKADAPKAAPPATVRTTEQPARLCLGGSSNIDGSLAAKYRLEHLPLRLLLRLGAPDSPVRLRGELGGEGEIVRTDKGALTGNARIASDKGELFYSGGANQPLLGYTDLALDIRLDGSSTTAQVRAALDHDGHIDGRLNLAAGEGGSQALSGNLGIELNSLAFLELLSSELGNTQGRLGADYAIAGTLAAPRLDGALTLTGFATEIPLAGLKLRDGTLSLRAADERRYVLEGSVASGTGRLAISGEGGLDLAEPMKVTLKGENFTAADIPAARVVLSPDLVLERNADGILVTGKLLVPSATVDLARLPGAGAASVSPDVVIVDADQPEPGKPVPITARVTVSLGDKVKLAGYGFDGTLSGELLVNERPGRATTGSGTLNAGGTYKAYGQDLKIETGRVLFAGTAIDNPGIDIRAVRKIQADNVTAGLLVRGTAQLPVLTVFAEPSMEQSEALSYLVTGKPLSSLKSGEGDMLGTAARALGTAGGDLLAKSIGGRLGVDDIGVADNGALGGAAFTVGKYLSPKLYLSYGVGVFEPGEVVTLRYLLNRRWNFEAQNATNGSRAGFNYRIEK